MSVLSFKHGPVTSLTEEEAMLRDAVAKFAHDVVKPRVREMDANSQMAPEVIKGLFDNGFMGIEIPEEHGGSGSSFLAACLTVEELAKIDPSVAVLCDVQNTLVGSDAAGCRPSVQLHSTHARFRQLPPPLPSPLCMV